MMVGASSDQLFKRFHCNERTQSVQFVVLHAQDEVDHDSSQESDSQNGGTKAVIETALSTATDTLSAPVKCDDCINHGGHCNDSEEGCGDATDTITEVQQTDGQTAQDNGKVQP